MGDALDMPKPEPDTASNDWPNADEATVDVAPLFVHQNWDVKLRQKAWDTFLLSVISTCNFRSSSPSTNTLF